MSCQGYLWFVTENNLYFQHKRKRASTATYLPIVSTNGGVLGRGQRGTFAKS